MFWADQFEHRIGLLTLEGRLSKAAMLDLADRLRGLAARGMSQVVVDVRLVEHWDFRGLPALSEAVAFRKEHGGSTAFITPNDYLRDIAKAAGVFDALDFYDGLRLDDAPSLLPAETTETTEAARHVGSI